MLKNFWDGGRSGTVTQEVSANRAFVFLLGMSSSCTFKQMYGSALRYLCVHFVCIDA